MKTTFRRLNAIMLPIYTIPAIVMGKLGGDFIKYNAHNISGLSLSVSGQLGQYSESPLFV